MKTQLFVSAVAMIAVCIGTAKPCGETLYGKHCAKCHGKDGKGGTKMGKKLKIDDLTMKVGDLSADGIAKIITDGLVVDGKKRMKPTKGLSDEDVKALVEFVQSMKP